MPCSPRMRSCKSNCLHRENVNDYRQERERQEREMEEATALHAAEVERYKEDNDMITYQKWLKSRKRRA